MLTFGIISEVDASKGLARVKFPDYDGIVSNWLPMSIPKISKDKFSIPFDINEPVWCIMDNHFENGIIGGAYANKNALPDGGNNNKVRVKFDESLAIEFDRSTSTLSIQGNGKINIDVQHECNIKCQSAKIESLTKVEVISVTEVDITAPVIKVTGNMIISGLLTAGGISAAAAAGGGSGTGDMTIEGSVSVTGDISSTGGDVKAGLFGLKTHKHTGVTTGAGTTAVAIP